ncbi:UDP-glycosyltransferase 74E2 [Linum perenne]
MTIIVKQQQQHEHKNFNYTPPPHVMVLPFPFQGHINPALQFSKLLISKGLKVTLIISLLDDTTNDLTKGQLGSINVRFLSNQDINLEDEVGAGGFAILEKFNRTVKKKLPSVISEMRDIGYPVACLIYDSVIPWALDIAKEMNIFGASFFTMPCAVDTIFYNYHQGKIEIPMNDKKAKVCVEGIEEVFEINDLPSYLYDEVDINAPESLTLLSDQFSNVGDADWIFCNTFTSLEEKIVEWMSSKLKFKTVGPTIPSTYLGKHDIDIDDNNEYGMSLFQQPQSQTSILKWLDTQLPHSVVYVSFGSVATLSDKQTAQVAAVLDNINRPFLWVVRKTEHDKLPQSFVAERGMVVSWCCQLEVLAHKSTGCFVTHCGWNSTIEALSLGVPMVGVPQFADQPTNAKFVEDVWKVGVRVVMKKEEEDGEEGIMREEIEKGIMEVMEGERATDIRRNADKWKSLAQAAVAHGGTSNNNIQEFVTQLTSYQLLKFYD